MLQSRVQLSRLITLPFLFLKDRPVIYRGRSVTFVGYGLFAALNALAIVSLTSLYLFTRGHEVTPGMLLIFPLIGAGTWTGSKLMHLLALGRKFFSKPRKYLFETGFYVQGGIMGALASSAIGAQVLGLDMVLLWDGLGWSTLLGLFFGRLGCFNYGCCFGRSTSSGEGGVCYHNREVKILRLKPELAGRSVHPTQLYTALLHLTVFAGVTAAIAAGLMPNGSIAAGFLIYHGASRLLIERYRSDIHHHEGRNWTTFRSAGAMVLLGIAMFSLGPRLVEGFGQITPAARALGPGTMLSMLASHPALLLSFAAVLVMVLVGYGFHGPKLGTFPWSPGNQVAELARRGGPPRPPERSPHPIPSEGA